MPVVRGHRRSILSGGAVLLTLTVILGVSAGPARASGPPVVVSAWSSSVFSTTARLQGQVNPNGLSSEYHFVYITKAAFDANVADGNDPFSDALRSPSATDQKIGNGTKAVNVLQLLSNLTADTTYRYRLVAKNLAGTTPSPTLTFVTQPVGGGAVLADSRGWEMVTPVDKNGGAVRGQGTIADGGVFQAAAAGGSVTYSSEASFGEGGQGAPPASQYVANRSSGGWSAANISPPLFSGSYDNEKVGAPYQLFSGDLARGLLLNGEHCRGDATGCAVPNPPLSGTDAPTGYQNYYLRDGATAGFEALIGDADAAFLTLGPDVFDVFLAGTAADLSHGVLSTCAALTADATEVPLGEGCDPSKQNLYEYSQGGTLTLISILPGQSQGTPGAGLAAQSSAVSDDGGRVYFYYGGDLYLRQGAQTFQTDESLGGGGEFQVASADGAVAYFTKAGHLYRYLAGGGVTDLTPSGGVIGVLGASAAGDYVYFQDGAALKRWHATTATVVSGAAVADESNYLIGTAPKAAGGARVSADGTRLLFVSSAYELTGYDNTDLSSPVPCGEPAGLCDSQVYLYEDGAGGSLTCVSCNPTQGRPIGPSTIPGASANGSEPNSLQVYLPRSLSANGRRMFFESDDALVPSDTNNDTDVYEWEEQGEGSCNKNGGCLALISSGRDEGGATFVDASADGSDAFFLTDGALVKSDPGSTDLYDARIGGGFPVATPPPDCEADNCQSLPPPPVDPTLTTLLPGPGNPGVRYPRQTKHCRRGFVRRKGKCVRRRRPRARPGARSHR
jgi:hypothetical protein